MRYKKPVKKRTRNPPDTPTPSTPTPVFIENIIQTNGIGIFPKPQICIGSWNVNGIRAQIKKESFMGHINQERFDVMCFNETKMQESLVEDFKKNFTQYNYQYYECSKTKKGYAGVAILSRVEPISVKAGMNGKHDEEGRVLTAEFDDIYVVCTYRPNWGGGLNRMIYRKIWDANLQFHLKSLERTGKGVIWIGDINTITDEELDHWYKPEKPNKPAKVTKKKKKMTHFFSNLVREGWVDTFRHKYPQLQKFSYFSTKRIGWREAGRGWRLDYAIVSPSLVPKIIDSAIHSDVLGSDHHPIELIITNPKYQKVGA